MPPSFTAHGVVPRPWVNGVDLPRAAQRKRMAGVWAARRLFKRMRRKVDLGLIHDPELLFAIWGVRNRPPVVWDVHEDTPATLSLKPWLPSLLRPPVRFLARLLEGTAERHLHLLLAETAYAGRFEARQPDRAERDLGPRLGHAARRRPGGVPGLAVPGARRDRGRRGGSAAPAVPGGGGADRLRRPLQPADAQPGRHRGPAGVARLHAERRGAEAADGALAGLSLLHDEPNYRHSMPTKIVEYMAHGIPVITTPSPRAVELVERYDSGVVVPWEDPKAVAQAVLTLRDDVRERRAQGARGYAAARANHHWPNSAKRFVAQLESWAGVKN